MVLAQSHFGDDEAVEKMYEARWKLEELILECLRDEVRKEGGL